jgi:hypothetical protein
VIARRIGRANSTSAMPSSTSRIGSRNDGVKVGRPVAVSTWSTANPRNTPIATATTIVPALVRFTPRRPSAGRLASADASPPRSARGSHAPDARQHGIRVDLQPRPEHEVALRGARVRQGSAGSSLRTSP